MRGQELKDRKKNRSIIDKEWLEVLYFAVLTLLCAASLLRGCAVNSAEVTTTSVQAGAEGSTQTPASGQNTEGADDFLYLSDGKGVHDYTATDASVRRNNYDPLYTFIPRPFFWIGHDLDNSGSVFVADPVQHFRACICCHIGTRELIYSLP